MLNFSRRSYTGYDQSRNTLDRLDEDPIYEDQPTSNLRVVNGGLEPRHMRKGSYVEDDGYAVPLASPEGYGAVAAAFPVHGTSRSGGTPDVSSRRRDSKEQSSSSIPRPSGRSGGRSGNARRSLIQGPQPQPHSQSSSSSSSSSTSRNTKPHLPPNPASTVEAYRQQQQQLQQQYLSALTARQQSGRHSNQGIASSPSGFGRYSPPLEADEDAEDENMRASSRSIMIGFDSASSPAPVSGGLQSASSTPQTGSSSPPAQTGGLAPFPGGGRRASASSTNSSQGKRGYPSSSHYSQVSYVSTIPEESSDYGRHGSYASSHAIPSSWGSGAGGLWIPGSNEELMSDGSSSISKGSSKSRGDDYGDFDEGATLVRQASLGRKQKPKLTDVVRSDSKSRSSRSETTHSSHSQARKGSVASSFKADFKNSGARQLTEKGSVQSIITAGEIAEEAQPAPKVGFWQRLSQLSVKTGASDVAPRPLKFGSGKNSPEDVVQEKGWTPPSASAPFGPGNINLAVPQPTLNRPRPPRLNIDAVREAEARGSLTSLPELIRRATKLAAVLETGSRPDSRWGGSRAPSIMSTDTHQHGGRYQESLSDILASFPPPLASSRRLSSRGTTWPLPGEYGYQGNDPQIKRRRKICGLPLWAFIVLVLLAIIVATAAVILPVQLVSMSKDKDKKNNLTPDKCAKSNPCLNGGIADVEDGKCACICTNQFFGPTCAQSNDPACTSFSITDTTNGQFVTRNVSLGLAVPRLLDVSQAQYRVSIDAAALSNNFALQNTTCALQNALVTLNGRTTPLSKTDTISPSTTTGSDVALDESVVDFGRVAVLYLASAIGMKQAVAARESLGATFASGKDYGTVKVDDTITIDLTNLRISTGSGTMVVGGPNSRPKMLLHRRTAADDMRAHLIRRHKMHFAY
ncbi:hypothetical protein TWF696_005397 [Orbilia brochopaga]|uniref:EGF-like domain-containing protein n=1 Tax=Orbilia brochopaga TaxID=3140254 RepID=A0AAV9V1Z4_9PEZI